ncbi:hypothetical protein C8R46DRAFT_1299891 [Mycena filopes]|nr:hypothetical protein C8R46DRAFT_1299891 [Mycena filopes]
MHPQAINSTTFCPAPLDGTFSFPQLLEHHLQKSPRHVGYVYDDGQGGVVSVDFAQYIGLVHTTSRRIRRDLGSSWKEGGVVAIFAEADTLSFCMLCAAIMRAGLVPFCLSPRNSAAGVANLFQHVAPVAVYISPELAVVMEETRGLCGNHFLVFEAPTFEQMQLVAATKTETDELPAAGTVAMEDTVLILHSSGSTSVFSKPIYLSQRLLLQYLDVAWSGKEDYCGMVMGAQTLPNYHALGVVVGTFPFSSGITMALLRPTTPPIKPTPDSTLMSIIATRADFVLSTPGFIETWSESAVGMAMMKSLKALGYLGASLNQKVGDTLAANGINLCCMYGAMELGLVTPFLESHGKDWEYFTVRKDIPIARVPEEDGSSFYTLTFLSGPSYVTAFTNTTIDGRRGCSMSDLMEQHPENPELHRVYGRKDDILVLSEGLKISPGSVEAHIARNPLVMAVVIIGHGKSHACVIIQLKPQYELDLLDAAKESRVRDGLWISVDEANKMSPAHFHISRKMILLADPKKPFELTSKFQPRRRAILEQYAEEIARAYM